MKKSPFEGDLWLGFELFAWLRLLARNQFAIERAKAPRAALITLAAVGNSALRAVQSLAYGRRVRRISVPDDPIFVVGHWRTGTTLLHELLALDPQHRCPTTYESLSPNHFLLSEPFVRRFGRRLLPRMRPFDNMKMGFDRPQEDEAALALRGAPSPFLTAAFPHLPMQSPEYVDLEALGPRQLAAWQGGFRTFLQLLLYRRPGRLVLKSPQHTNRLKTLGEMFPQARFIHVVRNPYAVFPSTMHFWRVMYQRYGLQSVDESLLREQVFTSFMTMHAHVEKTRSLLGGQRLYELHYEDLAADPVAAAAEIYRFLGRDDFASVSLAMARFAEQSRRYKTNAYNLDDATRAEIASRWAPYFKKYGYAP